MPLTGRTVVFGGPGTNRPSMSLTPARVPGHHKTAASAATGQPLRLLSLLSLSGGNTDPAWARAVPALMENAPSDLRWPDTRR
jgi:hypothetical protein